MGKLILLFTAIPIVELWLLLSIGQQIGFWPTVALALGTAVLGAALAKREGLRVLGAWQGAMAEGRVPDEGLTGGLLVLLGAALLITPGVLTDVAGLLLLIPPTRRRIAAAVRERFERRVAAASAAGGLGGLGGDGPGGAIFNVRVVDFSGGPFGGGPFGERAGGPDGGADSGRAAPREVIDVEAVVTEDDERGGPVPTTRRLPG
ncbi:exlusion protein FxsA [Sorangium cellulosum]|uniref:Exlusion protein FxsA n=1 Tax=Sorangium cellulosum TaxID=56 RepID=A0A2L0ERK9_SORCE|nr:FxsA family protein [Sorangium cellulosum]AUX41900.1 exlusion protein FxsA [Sorangium cellulosum]